mmetsp:Transcript_5779/g.12532  ORF Transcript_5779/g.12532 Transcript_5779/m.12532 type:complete len:170 (+) Transcript_5779:156-665(+)
MDSFKSCFPPEDQDVLSSVRLMIAFLQTKEDRAYFGTLSFCILVALFIQTFGRHSTPMLSPNKFNISIAVGVLATCTAFSTEIQNGHVTVYHGILVCITSLAVFAMLVSLSIWIQMLKSCVTFIVWVIGTLLMLCLLGAALLNADELSEWEKWVGQIIRKGSSMFGRQW